MHPTLNVAAKARVLQQPMANDETFGAQFHSDIGLLGSWQQSHHSLNLITCCVPVQAGTAGGRGQVGQAGATMVCSNYSVTWA